MSEAPTRLPALLASVARIRLANGSLESALSLRSGAERVALVGNFQGLFELLTSRATLESGLVMLLDMPFRAALESGKAAVAPLDPPLPLAWTCERYLKESANLLGLDRREATSRVATTLERFELGLLARRTLGSLSALDRRVLGVVRATLSDPEMLICEAPLHGLSGRTQVLLSAALERAALGRTVIASFHEAPRFGLERALLESCGEIFELESEAVRRRSSTELDRSDELSVIVSQNADAFAQELIAREVSATRLGQVEAAYAFVYAERQTDCVRFRVHAQSAEVRRKILEASDAAFAPLLELQPAP